MLRQLFLSLKCSTWSAWMVAGSVGTGDYRAVTKKLYPEYRRARDEMRELLTVKANVDRVLNMEAPEAGREKDHSQR